MPVLRAAPKALHAADMQIRPFVPETDAPILAGLADLLVEAVAQGASIGFMAGTCHAEALRFWALRAAAVTTGEAVVLVALADGAVAGTVSLMFAAPPNQRHRADVGKMMVGSAWQRQGLGAALIAAVEAEALAHGRTTLVLDTISNSAAARLYARCGWERIGEIRDYALMPDGAMAPTTVYSKHLSVPLQG